MTSLTGWPGRFVKLGKRSKAPVLGSKRIESDDPQEAERWLGQGFNVGLVPDEQLIVVDVDPRNGGTDTFQAIRPNLCPSVIALSGGGGMHMFYKWPEQTAKPAGKLGQGIDIKHGANAHVVAPGSTHPDTGKPYTWASGKSPLERPIADAPEWLILQLTRTERDRSGLSDVKAPILETPENVERARNALASLDPDCEYDLWRDRVWSILSTGWTRAVFIAQEWSQQGQKWDEAVFENLVRDFDPDRGITLGTLFHHAKDAGWVDQIKDTASNVDVDASPMGKALAKMNTNHFVARMGGAMLVFDERDKDMVGQAMTFPSFQQRYIQKVEGQKVSKVWFEWEGRRQYDGVVFSPSHQHASNEYNLYSGFAVTANAGDCSLVLAHIRSVWCGGDEAQYNYVIGWMAQAVQQPAEKPEVALVLRSAEGTGKTTLTNILLSVFGPHGYTAAQKDQVAGRFNGHLMDKILIVLEEAFFAGDPQAVAAIKVLVTNRTLAYENKGKAVIQGPSYHRVIALTNNNWAVPAGADARRWMVLDVSDHRRGDHAYFSELHQQINSGGKEAFLDYLLKVDLGGFNPRVMPKSRAMAGQRRETLLRTDPVAAWVLGVLESGYFDEQFGTEWDVEVPKHMVHQSYEQATAKQRIAPAWNQAARRLRELVPGISDSRRISEGKRVRAYKLPPIEDARVVFTEKTGIPIEFEGV